ncbi:uncharacterized protein Eint_110140 [Encephalitozoon intestinalis ATCC 50506]|uniref:Clathrin/coatomer adaptor adaptin-like N-terminal domain-containing protein n=1 Tax=Encephalitozoon intestinalis (strain ATCC 50506) TaxID=876142 RepID=E0SA91_ENCIT|nr:uncharacterized protein Eint_110140 [Encephalitozoon intestinalis ATCC 50506]ADM12516.1 hypothetical protein Eint_110140 [Encephalitozoon intestinalis ATCC 50506]UTX46369.1 putative ap-2 complex subunit alpha 2 [Encephalitozoon intestinalis]
MSTRIDPILAAFISSFRELPIHEKEGRIIKERRKMTSSAEAEPHIRHSNVLKFIYMKMLSYEVNEIDFLNACESDILRIKTAGYLGLMAMESDEYVIMAINTIMKDLGKKETRNDALTSICNLNNDGMALSNLMGHVCPKGKGDPFHKKALVAFFRLNPGGKISIVGQDPSEVYVKSQILIDIFGKTGKVDLSENDILFLLSLFMKSDNPFLRIKILQVFGILHSKNQLSLDRAFLDTIDGVIIPPKDKVRPQIEIALAIEAVEFLLKIGKITPKAEAFVLRLIESQNPNSRYFGLKIVRRYKIHRDIAIECCIKLGLHHDQCLKTLISLITRNNHKTIYKKKEEMIFYMEKGGAGKKTVNDVLATVFSKLLQYVKDEHMIKIYQEVPEICLKMPLDKNIPKGYMLKLFNRICVTVNSRYFPLIYQLLQSGMENEELYTTIFERHLNILSVKRNGGWEISTLIRLLDCMLNFGSLTHNRNILIAKYKEILKEEDTSDILDMLLNTAYLLNTKLGDSIIHVVSEHFIYFTVSKNYTIEFRTPPSLEIKLLAGNGTSIEKVYEKLSEEARTTSFHIEESSKLNLQVFVGNQIHILNLEV